MGAGHAADDVELFTDDAEGLWVDECVADVDALEASGAVKLPGSKESK